MVIFSKTVSFLPPEYSDGGKRRSSEYSKTVSSVYPCVFHAAVIIHLTHRLAGHVRPISITCQHGDCLSNTSPRQFSLNIISCITFVVPISISSTGTKFTATYDTHRFPTHGRCRRSISAQHRSLFTGLPRSGRHVCCCRCVM